MTLQLELGQVADPYARRAFEQVALNGGGGGQGLRGPEGPEGPPGPSGGSADYSAAIESLTGLVAYYKLQDAAAATVMDAEVGTDGTYGGGVTLANDATLPPFLGTRSATFDGTNDYAQAPVTINSPNVTISVWAQLPDPGVGDHLMFELGPGTQPAGSFLVDEVSGGEYYLQMQGSSGYAVGTSRPQYKLGTVGWHHFAFVLARNPPNGGALVQLFFDGELEFVSSVSNNGTVDYGAKTLNIMSRNAASNWVPGSLVHLALYDRVLKTNEIEMLASTGAVAGPEGPEGPAGAGAVDATTSVKGIVQLAGDLAGTAASPQIAAGVIVNADINAAAAIAYAKLALTGSIVNADIAAGAAIAKSKLAALSIVNADVNAAAAIAKSKLNLTGQILDADIGAGAAIDQNKLNLAIDTVAAVPSLRSLGITGFQAAAGNDARFTDSRVPTGAAGGDLGSSYPNPTVVKSVGDFTVGGRLLIPTVGVLAGILLGGDANLYRYAAGVLKTDGALGVGPIDSSGVAATQVGVYFTATGFISPRRTLATDAILVTGWLNDPGKTPNVPTVNPFSIFPDGRIEWGSGGTTRDVSLFKNPTNTGMLQVGNQYFSVGQLTNTGTGMGGPDAGIRIGSMGLMTLNRAGSGQGVMVATTPGDVGPRLSFTSDGQILFGPGSTVATDTVLKRIAAATLQLPGTLLAEGFKIGVSPYTATAVKVIEGGAILFGAGAPGYTQRFFDDFSVDRMADDYDASASGAVVSGGVFTYDSSAARYFNVKIGVLPTASPSSIRQTIKVFPQNVAAAAGIGHVYRYIDNSNHLRCEFLNAATPVLRVVKVSAATTTALATSTTVGAVTLGTGYWLRSWLEANTFTAEFWLTDPALGGAPAKTLSHTLVAGDITLFPQNSGRSGGFRTTFAAAGTVPQWTADDFLVETLVGRDLDVYRDTTNFIEYGPRTNGAWGTGRPYAHDLPKTITGSRASGAALVDLLTKLASAGIIVDSTTA